MNNEPESNLHVRAAWDTNAAFWDERMGEGNAFHLQLVEPSVLTLLELKRDEGVLEIACGNGQFARKLTSLGARVVATDFSLPMLERARAHTEAFNDQIDYRVTDATNKEELRALGEHVFDAVVCNMAIMDMLDIAPLFHAIPHLLKPRGRFVFSTMHPCFNSNNPMFVGEMKEENGTVTESYALKLTRYLESKTYQGLAMFGQPAVQYYFHRPLHELLGEAFRVGLVMDGLLEPRLPHDQASPRWSSWLNYHEFPPVMVARARPQ
jgi:2-polyprenyl-3-methyl-5-hydroxy-6-metoxy-1,4-benzoquinol methylase